MIRVSRLAASYRRSGSRVGVFSGIDFTLEPRTLSVLIGPSGSGKTTLLSILAGLLTQEAGEAFIDGREIRGPSPDTAIIFQDHGLLPWKTVWQNAALGLQIMGRGKAEIAGVVEPILGRLGLSGLEGRYPAELSGGQRQRVAIARALAARPRLLLLDEPFSSVDALAREGFQDLLLELWRERDLTVVHVTHGIEEAVYLGQRIFLMDNGTLREVLAQTEVGSEGFRDSEVFVHRMSRLRSMLKGAA